MTTYADSPYCFCVQTITISSLVVKCYRSTNQELLGLQWRILIEDTLFWLNSKLNSIKDHFTIFEDAYNGRTGMISEYCDEKRQNGSEVLSDRGTYAKDPILQVKDTR